MKYNGQKRNWWAHQKQQLPHTTLCPLTSTRWIETKINKRTQHFFCVFHKKWTTALKLKSQKFDEQSWYPPKLIELCMVAMLWRHGLIKFDNCSRLAMFWTFRSHVRLNIVTVNLLESFSLHWSFYRTNLNATLISSTLKRLLIASIEDRQLGSSPGDLFCLHAAAPSLEWTPPSSILGTILFNADARQFPRWR